MIQRAGGSGFTFQTVYAFRAVEVVRQKFQRRISPQASVVGKINSAHPSSTQFSDQVVVPNRFSAETLRRFILSRQ